MMLYDEDEDEPELFEINGRKYQNFISSFIDRVNRYMNPSSTEATPGTIINLATFKYKQHSMWIPGLSEKDILFVIKEVDCPPHGPWGFNCRVGYTTPGAVRVE